MSLWDLFKPPAMRAFEAQARIDAARVAREQLAYGMGEVPRSTDEARAYAFALDLVRRRGAGEASRIADLVVLNVQMLSRQ